MSLGKTKSSKAGSLAAVRLWLLDMFSSWLKLLQTIKTTRVTLCFPSSHTSKLGVSAKVFSWRTCRCDPFPTTTNSDFVGSCAVEFSQLYLEVWVHRYLTLHLADANPTCLAPGFWAPCSWHLSWTWLCPYRAPAYKEAYLFPCQL